MLGLGFRVAQVRAIFTLPDEYGICELTYVEMFTMPHTQDPIRHVGLHRIRREMFQEQRVARIIPLSLIYL